MMASHNLIEALMATTPHCLLSSGGRGNSESLAIGGRRSSLSKLYLRTKEVVKCCARTSCNTRALLLATVGSRHRAVNRPHQMLLPFPYSGGATLLRNTDRRSWAQQRQSTLVRMCCHHTTVIRDAIRKAARHCFCISSC